MATEDALDRLEREQQQRIIEHSLVPTTVFKEYRDGLRDLRKAGCRWVGQEEPPGFRRMALPDRWRLEPYGHEPRFTAIRDEYNRVRAVAFHKAAPYDRKQYLQPVSLARYVTECATSGAVVVLDEKWATPAAVARTIRSLTEKWHANMTDDNVRTNFCVEKITQLEQLKQRLALPQTADRTLAATVRRMLPPWRRVHH